MNRRKFLTGIAGVTASGAVLAKIENKHPWNLTINKQMVGQHWVLPADGSEPYLYDGPYVKPITEGTKWGLAPSDTEVELVPSFSKEHICVKQSWNDQSNMAKYTWHKI